MSDSISAQERKDLRKVIDLKIGKLKTELDRKRAKLHKTAKATVQQEQKEALAPVLDAFTDAMAALKKAKATAYSKESNYGHRYEVEKIAGVYWNDEDQRIKKELARLVKEEGLLTETELTELGEDLCLEVIVGGITSEEAKNILARIPSGVTK